MILSDLDLFSPG